MRPSTLSPLLVTSSVRRAFIAIALGGLSGCGAAPGIDAGPPDASESGVADSGRTDAGSADAGSAGLDASVGADELRLVALVFDRSSQQDGGRRVYIADERSMIAWWREPDGGQWASSRGTQLTDGGYRFRGVPPDVETTIVFPSGPSVVTRARLIDASIAVQGRADALPPPVQPTTLSVLMSGPTLTTAYESLAAYSPDTPFVVRRPVTAPGLFTDRLDIDITASKLPVCSSSDRLVALRFTDKGTGTPQSTWLYSSPVAAGETQLVDLQPGQTATVPVGLSMRSMATASIGLDSPSFATNDGLAGPYSVPSGFTFAIRSVPGVRSWGLVTNGFFQNAGAIDVVSGSASSTAARVRSAQFEWVDAFPRNELVATLVHTTRVGFLRGSLFVRLPHERTILLDPPDEIRSGLSPPTNPRVNGLTVEIASGESVGATPLIEWDAPAVGVPARYTVSIARLVYDPADVRQEPKIETFATFVTQETHLHVPPLTLTQSSTLVVLIRAWSGAFEATRPNFVPVPNEVTTSVIAGFTP